MASSVQEGGLQAFKSPDWVDRILMVSAIFGPPAGAVVVFMFGNLTVQAIYFSLFLLAAITGWLVNRASRPEQSE